MGESNVSCTVKHGSVLENSRFVESCQRSCSGYHRRGKGHLIDTMISFVIYVGGIAIRSSIWRAEQ